MAELATFSAARKLSDAVRGRSAAHGQAGAKPGGAAAVAVTVPTTALAPAGNPCTEEPWRSRRCSGDRAPSQPPVPARVSSKRTELEWPAGCQAFAADRAPWPG